MAQTTRDHARDSQHSLGRIDPGPSGYRYFLPTTNNGNHGASALFWRCRSTTGTQIGLPGHVPNGQMFHLHGLPPIPHSQQNQASESPKLAGLVIRRESRIGVCSTIYTI